MAKNIKKMEGLIYTACEESDKQVIDFSEDYFEDCLKHLTEKDLEYIDPNFKPDEVRIFISIF